MDTQTDENAALSPQAVAPHRTGGVDTRVFCEQDKPVLHHIGLFVSDLTASVKFYTDGLGLALHTEFEDIIGLRDTGDFPFDVASIFLEAGDGRYVELHPAGQGEMSPPGFPLNHLALGVTDVDAAYDRALAAGATPADIPVPKEQWDGSPLDVVMSGRNPEPMRMAFLLGPSGELIELYQSTTKTTRPAQAAT